MERHRHDELRSIDDVGAAAGEHGRKRPRE
jgi:hypothetical protein